MAKTKFGHVKISGISVVVPPKEICIYDEAKYYDNNIKKIDRMRKIVGFYKRRVVDKDVTASDLALQAAENLIADMKIDKSTIDALVFVVQKPDYTAPATAYSIHSRLGLSPDCHAFDVNQGCPGWVYGLWITSQMVESKTCKRVLFLVGDNNSAEIDLRDRYNAPLFGDGGVATLVEYSDNCEDSYFNIGTFSENFEALSLPASGARFHFNPSKKSDLRLAQKLLKKPIKNLAGHKTSILYGYMDGIMVFAFTISEVPNNIKELMEYAKVEEKDIACLCLHQANKQIIQTVAEASGFPLEKAPYYAFENYGNNTLCSIPTTINSVLKDDIETNSKTILCSAFGNGLTCASCVITLDKIYSSGIRDYQKPKSFMSRKKYINYWNNKLEGEIR